MLFCIICGSANTHVMASATGERAYCGSCFHGWRTDQRSYSYSTVAMCSQGTSPARLEAQIRFFAPFTVAGAKILEIGCATGELARSTREILTISRYDAIELSPAAEKAKAHVDRLYAEPLRSLLEKNSLDRDYDIVLISHVLEHIEDPLAELRAMKLILNSRGVIFLEVPNESGNRKLPFDDNKSHLHFFSANSLLRLLSAEGLDAISVATDVRLDARYADSLQVIAQEFRIPVTDTTVLTKDTLLEHEEEIVVWGAGSLAEEILANFFDCRQIGYFIDSDPQKQGSLLLGKPVLGPEALGNLPRTVLINSIDFAAAIAADIARLYPNAPHRLVWIGDLLH